MPSLPDQNRTRATCRPLLVSAFTFVLAFPAFAQEENGAGNFFTRGFGGGGGERESGAYVSPSAIPDGSPADLGVNLPRPLQRLEPIALPPIQQGAIPPSDFSLPALPAYAPQNGPSSSPLSRVRRLRLDARLTKDGQIVPSGLVWRLFASVPDADGKLPLVASFKGGSADFDVPAGSYLMHVGFGRAGVTRRIDFGGETIAEEIVLEAGGLRLNARTSGDAAIPPEKLSFDVYSGDADERDRRLVVGDVGPGATVPLNAGTYRVVSRYGLDNAEVGGEVKVEPGHTTDVTLQHRAAELTMKLVREKGGEAIADTAWQVTDAAGAIVRESVGAFPSMILSEGHYFVVAKNRDRTYQRDFTVETGLNSDVELLTTESAAAPTADGGSGD